MIAIPTSLSCYRRMRLSHLDGSDLVSGTRRTCGDHKEHENARLRERDRTTIADFYGGVTKQCKLGRVNATVQNGTP